MKDAEKIMEEEEEEEEVALAFSISVKDGEVEVRWLRGKDSVIFESFCGMLKRACRQVKS